MLPRRGDGHAREDREVTRESLERGSVRILARRFRRSKTTILKTIHRVTASLPGSVEIARRFSPCWSTTLLVDGKYVRVAAPRSFRRDGAVRLRNMMCWIAGVDFGTGDIPHYALADEETMIDLVLFFERLKGIGYVLRVLVCDGNDEIIRAAIHVYGPGILVQLCTRHFTEGLRRKAVEAGLGGDPRTEALIAVIQRIIEADGLEEAGRRFDALAKLRYRHPGQRLLLADFMRHRDRLTTHLQHPELRLPHTTNDIENFFRQLNLRLKSFGQFMHWRFAERYLKAWALLRRFTPFTDCKGARKTRNGKAPLECAGCRIKGVNIFEIDGSNQP